MNIHLLPQAFFITGTDTDIGKTFVARLLADTFAEMTNVTYMKPVQTGVPRNTIPTDYAYVMKGKAVPIASLETHVPYRFTKACSPHLAALIDKKKITIGHIAQQLSNLRKKFNGTIIVEGAGGLMVPLSTRVMMIDLIIKLRIPVVLVTHPNLGSLNHTFLSIDKLKSKNIPIAGVVINHYQSIKKNVITADNIVQITRHVSPVPVLSVDFNGSVNQSTRRFCRAISE